MVQVYNVDIGSAVHCYGLQEVEKLLYDVAALEDDGLNG